MGFFGICSTNKGGVFVVRTIAFSKNSFYVFVAFGLLAISSINFANTSSNPAKIPLTEMNLQSLSPSASNLKNLTENADPLELGDTEVITVVVNEPQGVLQVFITFEGANHTMQNIPGTDQWICDDWTPSATGVYFYEISEENSKHKWSTIIDSIRVVDDATPPNYVILGQKEKKIDFGKEFTLSINVSDSSGIMLVLVEFEGENRSMINIEDNIWQYSWTPCCSGIYYYKIYMEDNFENLNEVTLEIEVLSPSTSGDDDDDDAEVKSNEKKTEVVDVMGILLIIVVAIGTVIGAVSMQKVRSRKKGDRTRKSKELENFSKISRDKKQASKTVSNKVARSEKNIRINELSPALKCEIAIVCPICQASKKLCIPKSIINESKQLSTISIPKKLVCDHHFQVFVDKNFVVRGYQKVDFEIDPSLAAKFKVCKE